MSSYGIPCTTFLLHPKATCNGYCKTFKLLGEPWLTIAVPRGGSAPKNYTPIQADLSISKLQHLHQKMWQMLCDWTALNGSSSASLCRLVLKVLATVKVWRVKDQWEARNTFLHELHQSITGLEITADRDGQTDSHIAIGFLVGALTTQ